MTACMWVSKYVNLLTALNFLRGIIVKTVGIGFISGANPTGHGRFTLFSYMLSKSWNISVLDNITRRRSSGPLWSFRGGLQPPLSPILSTPLIQIACCNLRVVPRSTDLYERNAVNSLQQFSVDEVDADVAGGSCELARLATVAVLPTSGQQSGRMRDTSQRRVADQLRLTVTRHRRGRPDNVTAPAAAYSLKRNKPPNTPVQLLSTADISSLRTAPEIFM